MSRSIFITGAASGMGRATALHFARQGWFVGGFDVDAAGLASLAAEIGAEKCLTGTLDLLFNNPGIARGGLFDEQPWDEVMQVINVNLIGVMIGIRAGLPLLRNTPGSLCLVNASSSAIWGSAGIGVYSATKHAVRGLVEALSIEFKRYGVRAADLLPGLIDTPLLSDKMRAMAPANGPWRLVTPDEVAQTVWAAYQSDRLHWYVPEELRGFHAQVVADPEGVREERTELARQMMAG